MFKPLQREEILQIITLEIGQLERKLNEQQMYLDVSIQAKGFILDQAYDIYYGARPIKRYIERHIETSISKLIIRGDVLPNHTIYVTFEDNKLMFNVQKNHL
jgi:ATP-dependent Clp protease ATP-binding subunit ClpB